MVTRSLAGTWASVRPQHGISASSPDGLRCVTAPCAKTLGLAIGPVSSPVFRFAGRRQGGGPMADIVGTFLQNVATRQQKLPAVRGPGAGQARGRWPASSAGPGQQPVITFHVK